MTPAFEHNGRMRRLVTFLRRVVRKLYTKCVERFQENVMKMNFIFSEVHQSMNVMVNLTLYRTHCVHTSMNLRKMKFIS